MFATRSLVSIHCHLVDPFHPVYPPQISDIDTVLLLNIHTLVHIDYQIIKILVNSECVC